MTDDLEVLLEQNHGAALSTLGHRDQGGKLLREVLAWREEHQGEEDAHTWVTRYELADELMDAGRDAEAAEAFRAAHDGVVALAGEREPLALIISAGVGISLMFSGHPVEAESVLAHNIALAREVMPDEPSQIWQLRFYRAWTLLALEDYTACETLLLELESQYLGDPGMSELDFDRLLATCWLNTGREAQAEERLARAVARLPDQPPGMHRQRAMLLSAHGDALAALGRIDEARERYAEGLEQFERMGGAAHPQTRELLGRMQSLESASPAVDD